ncbi:MAG TPA: hypothetical protein VF167_16840 [Longimicrobiaceae bacterium]
MPSLRPLAFGELLDGAFTLYRRDFTTLFTTSLLAAIPLALAGRMMEAAVISEDSAAADPSAAGSMMAAVVLSALLWSLVWGALTRQTARQLRDEETSVRDGYARSLRVLPRMAGAGLVIMLAGLVLLIAVALVLALAALLLASMNMGDTAAGFVLAILSLVAFLVAVVVLASFFAVIPAMVVEDLGVWASLRRSDRLARGARLRILGLVIVSSIIAILPLVGISFLVGIGGAMWDVESAAALSPGQVVLQQLVTVVCTALTTPFMVGCFTLLYFDRRVRTEGYDIDLVAEALDQPSEPALS